MAVTSNKEIVIQEPSCLTAFPVKSGETIYKGTLVGIGADGYLYNITSANVSSMRLVGIVADDSNNATGPAATTASGSISGGLETMSVVAGDKTVRNVWLKGNVKLTFTSITQAMVGLPIYASDNYTVDDSVSGIKIGTLITYISATSGYVALNEYYNASGTIQLLGNLTAATSTTGGGILSLANPTGKSVLVEEFLLNVGTGSTGAATGDFGIAANGTTSNDGLLDGTNMQTTGFHSIGINGGTNGKYGRVWTSSQYITGTASATVAGLVGTYVVIGKIVG